MHGGRRGRATCILEEDTNPCLPAIEKLGVPKQVHRLASDAAHREVSKKNTLKTSHRILQGELLLTRVLSISLSTPG